MLAADGEDGAVKPQALRVLSLDGGGIRGISSLLILENIMENIRLVQNLKEVPRPCDYFDLIGGTSTGGIIAIMLGRMGMNVDECISAYRKVAKQAFTPKRFAILPARPYGAFSATQLEDVMKQVIRENCTDSNCLFRRINSGNTADSCPHSDLEFRDGSCTKTVVLAITKDNVDALPTLFTTYDKSAALKDSKIWEVARATSAATTFFKPIKVGRDGIEFIDAAFGFNNPCEVLIEEAQRQFPDRKYLQVLSLGTGLGDVVTIDDTRKSILKALKKMTTTTKKVAQRLDSRFGDSMQYHRFNVDRGLDDVSLSDWEKSSRIAAHTKNYLNENQRAIQKFVNVFISHSYSSSDDTETARPTTAQIVHIIPFPANKAFIGRKTVLESLRIILQEPGHQRVALVGLGGGGKTQVAMQLAYWMKENKANQSIFWLSAQSMPWFEKTCTDVVKSLATTVDDDPKQALRQYLGSKVTGNWFLIIDNADDIKIMCTSAQSRDTLGILDYIPESENGRVLFTTRSQEVAVVCAGVNVIELQEMTKNEAKDLFTRSLIRKEHLDKSQDGITDDLLQILTCLPLAIAQAAAYINMKKIPISEYLRLCKSTDQDMIELLKVGLRGGTYNDETRQAVATTWIISFSQIRETCPLAADFLLSIGWIEPKAIPRCILPHDRETSEQAKTDAIGTLCGYGFLGWREDGETLDMQSLVHLAVRSWAQGADPEGTANKRDKVVNHIASIFPSNDWDHRDKWRQYMPHALRLIRASAKPNIRTEIDAILAYKSGICLQFDGRLAEALEVLNLAVRLQDALLPDNHPDRLRAQYELANVYRTTGNAEKAVSLLQHVVSIRESTATDNIFELFAAKHLLARALLATGQTKQAVELQEQVVALGAKPLPENDTNRIAAEHCLAVAYHANGQVKEAVALHRAIVDRIRRIWPGDHPDRLVSEYEFARASLANGQVADARRQLEEVLGLQEEVLHDGHPDVVASRKLMRDIEECERSEVEMEKIVLKTRTTL